MAEKCEICSSKIESDSMGKLSGTIIKVKNEEKNEHKYVCSKCQKEGKDKELLKLKKK